jgi:hypothetical protein
VERAGGRPTLHVAWNRIHEEAAVLTVVLTTVLAAAPRATGEGGFLRDDRAIFEYIADNEDIPEDKPDR